MSNGEEGKDTFSDPPAHPERWTGREGDKGTRRNGEAEKLKS
jgi:hypothetical protein